MNLLLPHLKLNDFLAESQAFAGSVKLIVMILKIDA